ncbi:MAG: thiamine ABC transporter substrate-binding protein [Rectinemataceae bacterium]
MMRAARCFLFTVFMAGALLVGAQELVVWTYDSFMSEWGPAASLAKGFEQQTGAKVRFISKGDGGALLSSLLDPSRKPNADVVIGLDDRQLEKALASDLFEKLPPDIGSDIPSSLKLDTSHRLLPYDFGQFAFIWDSASGIKPPASLEDLTRPEYRKKVIIMDPRTSTPGLGFLAWTQAVYRDGWKDYWKRLAPSLLMLAPSWDTGYGLFVKGEAPLVLSYSTSPAYHKAYEKSERYKALQFAEGHPQQIEFAGVLRTSTRKSLAIQFLAYLLSPQAQAMLPETQWMFPANGRAVLPASFSVVKVFPALKTPLVDIDRDPATAAALVLGTH